MNKLEIEAQRTRLLSYLSNIGDIAKQVQDEMQKIPYRNGSIYKSLKPKSGSFVVGDENGFKAKYQGSDGQWYVITFSKRESR
jgi:hypothetical protein